MRHPRAHLAEYGEPAPDTQRASVPGRLPDTISHAFAGMFSVLVRPETLRAPGEIARPQFARGHGCHEGSCNPIHPPDEPTFAGAQSNPVVPLSLTRTTEAKVNRAGDLLRKNRQV